MVLALGSVPLPNLHITIQPGFQGETRLTETLDESILRDLQALAILNFRYFFSRWL
jgi:C4-type Zn-finger protein